MALVAVLTVGCITRVHAAEAVLDPQCEVLFSADDQRLFEFVKTRRDIDFAAYAGKPIRSIQYVTLPIFNEQDDKENNWLYRAANWIHIPTKSSPIEQQLLVQL